METTEDTGRTTATDTDAAEPSTAASTAADASAEPGTSADRQSPSSTKSAAKKGPEPERTGRQTWPYAASAAAYLLAPFVLGLALPAGAATAALLALIPTAALLLGLTDGLVFRTTWAFPMLTTVLAFIGLFLYTNSGTWIYALAVLVLCRLGSWLGGRLRGRRRQDG